MSTKVLYNTNYLKPIYTKKILVSIGLILVLLSVLPIGVEAVAGVPKILNHQGRLLDSAGNLLGGTGTDYCFKFSIYDDVTVGAPDTKLWPTAAPSTMTISVKNGIFNVGVGDTSAGGDTLDFNFQDNDTVFLNTEVATKVGANCAGGDEVFENLGPRQRVLASGYTINSDTVDGFHAAQSASGSQIPALTTGNLVLGGTNPQFNVTSANTLTLQGGAGTGDIQFFSSSNKLTSAGNLTLAGTINSGTITLTANANLLHSQGVGTQNLSITAGTGGTTAGLIVKLDTSGQVVTTATTDTNNAVGVAVTTTAASGIAQIAVQGVISSTADNTVTAGDFVGIGSATAGRAKSLGATYPSAAGTQVIGRALTGAAAGGSFNLMLQGLDNSISAGGGTPGGSDTQIQYNNANAFGGTVSLTYNNTTQTVNINQTSANTALSISNAPANAQSANTISISTGANVSGISLLVNNSGTGAALQIQDAGTAVFTIDASGNTLFEPASDGTTAFRIQNAANAETLLTADTTNNRIKIGDDDAAASPTTLLVLDTKADAGDPTGTNGATYYNTSSSKFRCFQASAWTDCIGAGGGGVAKESQIIFFAAPTALAF